jgi:maltose O-acetyltransferase
MTAQGAPPPSEKEKMLSGELYRADDPELAAERRRCQSLLRAYNAEPDDGARSALLGQLFGSVGPGTAVLPPLTCDYGYNIALGAAAFVNYGAIILDVVRVVIGDHAQIGTAVQILTADHPRDPHLRRSGAESGSPVTIEDNVWIGSGAIVCPGVAIGADSVVGAGSVVTRDIPAGVVAAGNPCRVIRSL